MKKIKTIPIICVLLFTFGIIILPKTTLAVSDDIIGKVYEVDEENFSKNFATFTTYTTSIYSADFYFFESDPGNSVNYYQNNICYNKNVSACITTLKNISKYWKIERKGYGYDFYDTDSYRHEYYNEYIVIPAEYSKPVYNVTCDKEIIGNGENSNCKVVSNNSSNLKKVSFKIETSIFMIKDETPGELFNVAKDGNTYNITAKSNSNAGNNILMQFLLVNENGGEIADANNIQLKDISYEDDVVAGTIEDLFTTLSGANNPQTYSQILIVSIFLSFMIICIVLLINKKRKNNKITINE